MSSVTAWFSRGMRGGRKYTAAGIGTVTAEVDGWDIPAAKAKLLRTLDVMRLAACELREDE